MICANCGKSISSGYFSETEEGMTCICIDCLLRYSEVRKRHPNHDIVAIYRMYQEGYGNRSIATFFETNPLTIGGIIKDIEKNLRGEK